MKSKTHFDPEFRANSRRGWWPIRSFGKLMIVVALIGLTLGVVSIRPQRRVSASPIYLIDPATTTMVQGPLQIPSAPFALPRDRFVIVARPDLDARMVIQARPDLDTGMVINPGSRGRFSRFAPSVGGGPLLPGQAPVPGPDQGGPYDWYRYPPVIPQPGPR